MTIQTTVQDNSEHATGLLCPKERAVVARLVMTAAPTSDAEHDPSSVAYLSLWPIRGYPKYTRQLAKHLRRLPNVSAPIEDLYHTALKQTGKKPGGYSSKFNLRLKPKKRADAAPKEILRYLFEMMCANAADYLLVPLIPTTLSLRTHLQLHAFLRENRYQSESVYTFLSFVDGQKKCIGSWQRGPGRTSLVYGNTLSPIFPMSNRWGSAFAPTSSASRAYHKLWDELYQELSNEGK